MAMQTEIKLTAAESALVDAFVGGIGQLPGDAGVTTQRSTLMQGIKTSGLPTRRREAWHYTDLRALLNAVPAVGPQPCTAVDALVKDSQQLVMLNGVADEAASLDGISVKPYSDSLSDGSALKGLAVLDSDDAIGRLNGAFVGDGYVIHVPEGFRGDRPIEIQMAHGGGFHNSRLPVSFGAHSRATVIERHVSTGDDVALLSSVSEVNLAEGAEITWVILQQQGAGDTHLGQIRINLAQGAKLTLYVINAGGKLVRQDIHVAVDGEESSLTLRGINLLGGDSHTDVTMVLGHNVPNTTSTEVLRNVVFDRAKGVFQGQIRVAPDAQKTDAKMSCNTLLLSDEAEFSSKPELEIFADDVICGHGATVADIDHNHLFYLASRGIPEKRARGLLVQAFVQETVEELEDEILVEALEGVIQDWLEKREA